MSAVEQTLANTKNNWASRVMALKELRALVQSDAVDHSSFLAHLRPLEIPMRDSLKDLRSQVVREGCITLSCLSLHLGTDMAQFAELMLPQLVSLLPNSAKVMASSANICVNYFVKVRGSSYSTLISPTSLLLLLPPFTPPSRSSPSSPPPLTPPPCSPPPLPPPPALSPSSSHHTTGSGHPHIQVTHHSTLLCRAPLPTDAGLGCCPVGKTDNATGRNFGEGSERCRPFSSQTHEKVGVACYEFN